MNNKIVLIAGGSASGKTYVVNEVLKRLGTENITHISMDDYYKDLTNLTMEERKKVNFDHPKSIDWKLFREQIEELKNGQEIKKPIYDFTVHNRSDKYEIIKPKKIIIIEGIMALVDIKVRNYADIKVFINCIRERRFLRRLIRDHEERARDYDNIIEQYFSTVQPMFEEVIQPSKNYADLILENSGIENKAIDLLCHVLAEELDK